MKKPSQRDRVIAMLADNEVVCATEFWREYMPAARNRISELRKEGWDIRTEQCKTHGHEDPQVQYRKVYSQECKCPMCRMRFPGHTQAGLF